jgi:hypothetical protein
MEPMYACKECGAIVEIKNGCITRICEHATAAVTASVEAKCKGRGKLCHASSESSEIGAKDGGPLAVRMNIANALIALAQKVLSGEFIGLQVDWQGGNLFKISAKTSEHSTMITPPMDT